MKPNRSHKRRIWFENNDPNNFVPVHFQPATDHIPRWYKSLENYKGGSPVVTNGRVNNATVKRCVPVYDALTFGYLAILHTDVLIEWKPVDDEYELTYHFAAGPPPLDHREHSPKHSLTLDDSFMPIEFVWLFRWSINTEPGSSVLITHPLNRFDLPFVTSSGVIDTDSGFTTTGIAACPFYLKKDFSGTIPAGTPMAQIIPFERHQYISEIRNLSEATQRKRVQRWMRHLINGYRREFRKPKSFK